MLSHLALGLALGIASGLLPGPCGLAVMTTAATRGVHRALAVAAGGGLGDGTYALLGTVAVTPLVARHPFVPTLLQLASGLTLITFGLRRPSSGTEARPPRARGLTLGLACVLSNPGALLSWATVIGSFLGRATPLASASTILGIGAGSALWLTVIAFISRRTTRLPRINAIVSVVLITSGALALFRAAHAALSL